MNGCLGDALDFVLDGVVVDDDDCYYNYYKTSETLELDSVAERTRVILVAAVRLVGR